MISFKAFVNSIHEAITAANQKLMDKNSGILDRYFEECSDHDHGDTEEKGVLKPKSVVVEYPYQTEDGIEKVEVHVPLITLVPLGMSHIKKAKFSADFEMEIENDEVQINFYNKNSRSKRNSQKTLGNIELTFAPNETPEGLERLVAGYEAILKSQIPS